MARLKRRPPPVGPAASSDVRVPLALVIDATSRDVRDLGAAAVAVLRDLRIEMHAAVSGTSFDPRVALRLPAGEIEEWHVERRLFLAKHFANDPRVLDGE